MAHLRQQFKDALSAIEPGDFRSDDRLSAASRVELIANQVVSGSEDAGGGCQILLDRVGCHEQIQS